MHLSGVKMCIFYFNKFLGYFFVLDSTLLYLNRFIGAKILNSWRKVKGFGEYLFGYFTAKRKELSWDQLSSFSFWVYSNIRLYFRFETSCFDSLIVSLSVSSSSGLL